MSIPASETLSSQFASEPVSRHFSDAALIAAMARFEAALALAQADTGLVPSAAAQAIARVCAHLPQDAARSDSPFRPDRLAVAARRAGTLAIPFVQALTEQVAAQAPEAARWVHFGATSQDVIDTALVLAIGPAGKALLAQTACIGDALAALADAHRALPMAGRTLLQQSTPVSFGWKAACWLSPLARNARGLAGALEQARVLQFGGASGVRGALGGRGDAVAAVMATRLGLTDPGISWHGSRDRIARLGAELALMAGGMARIGRDLALLMQTEIGEAFEPAAEGRGGSSAMPHKRNPVAAMLALQAGLRAPGLAATLLASQAGEHERGLGTWQSDWWTLGALFECAGSASQSMAEALTGLRLAPEAMAANLERGGGFVFAEAATIALAEALGRPAAKALMERLCAQAIARGCPLAQALEEAVRHDPGLADALPPAVRAGLFDPVAQLGDAGSMIDRVLREWRDARPATQN